MRMYDLILKKRNNEELTENEISFIIKNYVDEKIPDYQMSAFLMAVFFNGLTEKETLSMTMEVAKSGNMVDLSAIDGIKVDKHSTGGVGDKTSLIIAPIVASCGGKVAKMSGRGLGHTGGTIDKMDAIPNMKTDLTQEEFFNVVNKIGVSIIGQSANLAPADKKLYALRDVTATVDNIPLIAVSIMSKKIAAGSDCILLDVKTGSGAFMKSFEDSKKLAQQMVSIGENAGRKTIALITNMDIPLGNNIGNSLEIIEVIDVLQGKGPKDLTEVCVRLAENMLELSGFTNCREKVLNAIENGSAYKKFLEMVKAQGGDISVLENTDKFSKATVSYDVLSIKSGYITSMNTEKLGISSSILGAGRTVVGGEIDFSAGIILDKKVGDFVKENEKLATLYTCNESAIDSAVKTYISSLTFSAKPPKKQPLIYAKITKNGAEIYD